MKLDKTFIFANDVTDMIILIQGSIICVFIIGYFCLCELKASVFPALGFTDDETPIGKIEFNYSPPKLTQL